MKHVAVIAAALIATAGTGRSGQDVYPPLTRERLVGVWEGLFNLDTTYTVFHIAIAADNSDSYLVEITAGYSGGGVFRLEECSIAEGKVKLRFRSRDGGEWWFEGEGGGDHDEGFIRANFSTHARLLRSGPPYSLNLKNGKWVRTIGEASMRAAEILAEARRDSK